MEAEIYYIGLSHILSFLRFDNLLIDSGTLFKFLLLVILNYSNELSYPTYGNVFNKGQLFMIT